MLILSRKPGEDIVINDNIVITYLGMSGGVIRVGIDAPKEIPILRGELMKNPPKDLAEKIEKLGREEDE